MSLLILPRQLVVDLNGTPRVGAKLYVYDAGTSTPHPAYTTSALSVAHTQPVQTLSAGVFPAIYVDPDDGDYKIVITDIDDVVLPLGADNLQATISASSDILALIFDNADTQAVLPSLSRTPAEISAGVTPTNYAYLPGYVERYGADYTGVADSLAAIRNACLTGHPVRSYYGKLATYRITGSLRYRDYLNIDLSGAVLSIDGDNVSPFENNSGGSILYCDISNIIVRTTGTNTTGALDVNGVSRSKFHNIVQDRASTGQSFAYGLRLRASVGVCYWNVLTGIEITSVTNTGIQVTDGAAANEVHAKLVNHVSTLNLAKGLHISSGSENRFFALTLEAIYSTAGTAYAVQFDTGADQNSIFGLRTEAHAGSASDVAVYWNGGNNNQIIGHYLLGSTTTVSGSPGTNTWLNISTVGGSSTGYIGDSQLRLPSSAGDPAVDNGAVKYDSTAHIFKGFVDSSVRNFVTSRHGRHRIEAGTVTFSAATTAAVTFAAAEPDTDYRISLGSMANKTFWVSNKTVNGFTINASSSSSDTVEWTIVR
jgi:hypothetical protein